MVTVVCTYKGYSKEKSYHTQVVSSSIANRANANQNTAIILQRRKGKIANNGKNSSTIKGLERELGIS